ncbi:RHS repeat-associated core domain-containing protein, partial [Flavobacterium amniphilum]|uniref:RHS repeat domain-containing protein n=1 Tax=Flavobacterium amniphilum TaxID=1834035 RepID=UPI00202AB351
DRVLKQAAPGEAWKIGSNHEIKFEYGTNEASGSNVVKLFKATATWNESLLAYTNTLTQTENYPANTLYLTVTKDENWTSGNNHTTQEFKDKAGKVVLKRTFNNNVAHETYYVYDQFGNLAYVIPPLANAAYDSNTLNGLCYQYQYDNRNRLVSKKLPGKQWEFIVYDLLDRPVATGPVLSPWGTGTSGSMVTQYDVYGRPTQTGWIELPMDMNSRYDYQTDMNNGDNVFTLTTNRILSKNYYDNYSYAGAPTLPSQVEGEDVSAAVKGMPTGSWVRILTIPTETTGELSYTLYDKKGRAIRTHTDNYLGGYTETDSKLDFIGKTHYTITRHKRTGSHTEIVATDTFTYTDQDRLKLHTHQIDGGDVQLLFDNSYDELGQLKSKKVGGSATGNAALQQVDYQYNVRGWLKSINDTDGLISTDLGIKDDLFAFKISYNTPTDNNKALFNGNISETYWRTYNDDQLRKYTYSYDHLNRLLQADYSRPGNINILNSYKEHLTYDKNGNILSLNRNSFEEEGYEYEIDNLTYAYDSNNKNRLSKVTDSSGWSEGFNESTDPDSDGVNDSIDYTYDASGNMTKDQNKGINKITYNHLNLPVRIEFSTFKNPTIDYVYDATGRKVSKKVSYHKMVPCSGSGGGGGFGDVCMEQVAVVDKTDYLFGGFQYLNNVLEFVPHAEGYVKKDGNNYVYHYNHTDHLGNVRLTYAGDASGTPYVVEENNYYPFGLKHDYNYTESTNYKYKYNGKELQDELGLNMYDYGARNYDAAIGRWMNIDNLAEKNIFESTFVYCSNNPIIFNDPDGNDKRYFDIYGEEIVSKRVVSNEIHETYIARNQEMLSFTQVPMPNVISEKKGITEEGISFSHDVSGPEYQELDYLIAARTGLFNQTKNNGLLTLYTEGGDLIPQEAIDDIDDLDPTLVKAIVMQESTMGKDDSKDIATANNPLDKGKYKNAYNLYEANLMNKNNSLYFGIRFLATKGFRKGVTYDRKTGKKTFTFQGWSKAAGNYNGGGIEGYQEFIEDMINNSFSPTPDNYYKYKPQTK